MSILGAFRPKGGQHLSVHVEDLQPMVVGVRHHDAVAVRHGYVVGMLQLARLVAHRSELGHKSAVALEYLNAVVLLVADVDEPEAVRADAPRVVELPVRVAALVKDLDAMVGGVRHHYGVIQSN